MEQLSISSIPTIDEDMLIDTISNNFNKNTYVSSIVNEPINSNFINREADHVTI